MNYLTPNQVAARLNLKPETVREYIRTGRLRAVNLNPDGKRPTWRIKPEALEVFRGNAADETEAIYQDVKRRVGW